MTADDQLPHLFVEFRGTLTLLCMKRESPLPRSIIFLDCLRTTLVQLLSMMRGLYVLGYHVEVTVPLNIMQANYLKEMLERNNPAEFATVQIS